MNNNNNKGIDILGFLKRLVISMIVIGLTNVIVPGMSNKGGLLNLAFIALAIALIQHIFTRILGESKAVRGSTGFLVMALTLYLAGKFVPKYDVSILGALIGGLLYGLVDSMIPGDKLS